MTFTINLSFWLIPIALFIIPILYGTFRPSQGGCWIDFQLDTFLITAVCWISAVIVIITRLIGAL